MHKRMLFLSKRINQSLKPAEHKDVFENLYKAQTNCGYWHGIFGGFYLSHLRQSIYKHMILAQNLLDKKLMTKGLTLQKYDINFDGYDEVEINNKKLIAYFSTKGAALLEFSLRDKAFNIINTITRQKEVYHSADSKNDSYERLGLIDHILDKNISLDDFIQAKGIKTLSNSKYDLSYKKTKFFPFIYK